MPNRKQKGPPPVDPFDWQKLVSHIVVGKEYETFKSNANKEHEDLNALLDMLVCDRAEKDYDWQSDVFVPDLPSIIWTIVSEHVMPYFVRKEKVDCPVATNDPMDIMKAKAAKDFINYHLNARYLNYFLKFTRWMILNRLSGWAVAKCWWESDIIVTQEQTGTKMVAEGTGMDIYGNPYTGENHPSPERMNIIEQPIIESQKRILKDRPNFDVWPNFDVFMDNKFSYTLQEKDPIIFRSMVKYSELVKKKAICQYMNLDKLEEALNTETSGKTYNKQDKGGDRYEELANKWDPEIELLERWGTWPVLQDESGTYQSAIGEDGKQSPGSQLMPTIISVANPAKEKMVIRFQPNLPETGGYGFIPACRIKCYLHPIKDRGIGDGTYGRELQKAINDNFNMTQDRTKLATLPTLKKRKYALVENDTLQFGPEHVMEMENLDDVDVFQITDAPQGAWMTQDMLWGKMQQATATYTYDMGGTPTRKEPVTTLMLAEQKSNIRTSLVNLTVEHTGLQELYDIFLKMSSIFMQPETLVQILGDKTPFFDPNSEYNFTPVSTAILTENSKEAKIQILDQLLGRIINIPNPNTFMLINLILKEIFELAGKEYAQYSNALLDPNAMNPNYVGPIMQASAKQQQAQQMPEKEGPPAQNQSGQDQSPLEQAARLRGTAIGGGNMG